MCCLKFQVILDRPVCNKVAILGGWVELDGVVLGLDLLELVDLGFF